MDLAMPFVQYRLDSGIRRKGKDSQRKRQRERQRENTQRITTLLHPNNAVLGNWSICSGNVQWTQANAYKYSSLHRYTYTHT